MSIFAYTFAWCLWKSVGQIYQTWGKTYGERKGFHGNFDPHLNWGTATGNPMSFHVSLIGSWGDPYFMAYEIIPIPNRVVIHPLYAAKNQGSFFWVTAQLVASCVIGFPAPRTTSKSFAIRSPDKGNHVGVYLKNLRDLSKNHRFSTKTIDPLLE